MRFLSAFVAVLGMHAGLLAQDTFSILAFDSLTREVGAAGASCVDLFPTPFNDHFIAELFPDTGAVASQAYYIPANQAAARSRMRAGDSPAQIMVYMQGNDLQGNPHIRQYGAVKFGEASAAHTGTGCSSYAGHRFGRNYSIHGNILLGPQILDSMEARFLRAKGDLACRLMEAMQGANVPGADARCLGNNSSSLFAFLKVAKPSDDFSSPSLIVSLRTHSGDSIEPIDSLQALFTAQRGTCSFTTVGLPGQATPAGRHSPNPASSLVHFDCQVHPCRLSLRDLWGRTVFEAELGAAARVDLSGLSRGLYLCAWDFGGGERFTRLVLE